MEFNTNVKTSRFPPLPVGGVLTINYFSVRVMIVGRKRDLKGVRAYLTDNINTVQEIAVQELLKYYERKGIIKVDVRELPEYSEEVQEYKRKAASF